MSQFDGIRCKKTFQLAHLKNVLLTATKVTKKKLEENAL